MSPVIGKFGDMRPQDQARARFPCPRRPRLQRQVAFIDCRERSAACFDTYSRAAWYLDHTRIWRGMKLAALVGFLAFTAAAQNNPAARQARQWRQQHERAIVDEFVALLSIPNVASDGANIQRNAGLIQAMMERRGIASRLVSVPGANPVVFG